MSERILISIVMPSFQQADFIESAVRSVLDQKISGVELLAMDPGSTDGSREILSALQKEYGDRLVLCFESDQGQSDALNKGFNRSRGKILGWLNSDDRLRPGALKKVVNWLDSAEPRWIYGRAGIIDDRGQPCTSLISLYKDWRGRKFSQFKLLTENFIPQMAVFWNKAMWEKAGGLDNNLDLDMDYDLWLRFSKVTSPMIIRDVLADFRVHGKAKGSRQANAQLEAAFATALKHSKDLGLKGRVALILHRLFGWRTKQIYRLSKPK